jgi:protoporphyrinogen oxidase
VKRVAVLGGGLAGLSAGYILKDSAMDLKIFEAESSVGGASKTIQHNGFLFDLGGHRFYSKKKEINDFVCEILGDELIEVERISKIFLKGKLYDYPLRPFNAVSQMGPLKILLALSDYLSVQLKNRISPQTDLTYKDWVVRRFGKTLAQLFFVDYAEKIWGIKADEISKDFADQRIRSLSLLKALKNAFNPSSEKSATLIHRFIYPRHGFGIIAQKLANKIGNQSIILNAFVDEIVHSGGRINLIRARNDNSINEFHADEIISSIPITQFLRVLNPQPGEEVLQAADHLKFRSLIIVFLTLNREKTTDYTWMYFPSKEITFSRLHEPKNWSREMCPEGKTSLVVEYFSSEEEPFWKKDDEYLRDHTIEQLIRMGMINKGDCDGYKIVRLNFAYPLYDLEYKTHLKVINAYLAKFTNLQLVGRNGLFRYTSSDHYIDMGIKAAKNLLGEKYDLFQIGLENEYAEE